jgi:hypothetical protein
LIDYLSKKNFMDMENKGNPENADAAAQQAKKAEAQALKNAEMRAFNQKYVKFQTDLRGLGSDYESLTPSLETFLSSSETDMAEKLKESGLTQEEVSTLKEWTPDQLKELLESVRAINEDNRRELESPSPEEEF